MPLIRKCSQCKYVYNPKNPNIRLHIFPLCKELQNKWKEICDLNESDDVKNKYLCSKHFRSEEFYKPYSSSKGLYLKRTAVPTIKFVVDSTESTPGQPDLNLPCTSSEATESKEKWQNLRAVFTRHMKRGVSDPGTKPKKPYYLADAMQFALPFIKSLKRNKNGELPKQPKQEMYNDEKSVTLVYQIQSPHSSSLPPLSPPTFSMPSPTPQMSDLPSPTSSLQLSFDPLTEFNETTKRPIDSNDDDLGDSFDEYIKPKKEKLEEDVETQQEANKMFLLSLLPDMKVMSLDQVRMFKRKVMEIIDEVMSSSTTSLSPTSLKIEDISD